MHDEVSTVEESDDSDKLPNIVASTAGAVPTNKKDCVVCLDKFTEAELTEAPCGHNLCQTCIIRFVQQSMADETLFPPQCCQKAIPITTNAFLPQYLVNLFEEKSVEYSTFDRTYCSSQFCSKFIPPSSIEDNVATCPDCQHLTCVICKDLAHAGPCDSDSDTETRDLLALAADEGWKRCSQCGRVIELSAGCDVMRCICGFRFCYLCGVAVSEGCGCHPYGDRDLTPDPEQCHHQWQPFDHPDGEVCQGCDTPATETHPVQICHRCGMMLCASCRPLWPVGI